MTLEKLQFPTLHSLLFRGLAFCRRGPAMRRFGDLAASDDFHDHPYKVVSEYLSIW
jgi:hypothetical protein